MSHPNIVEIKAIVATSCPMLVMEYMPMGSLLAYLRIEKYEITNLQLLKFAADVAEVQTNDPLNGKMLTFYF